MTSGTKAIKTKPQAMPVASIRALMSRIVDYAGLFPPAKLDMPSNVRNYKSYIEGDDAWMLSRLVLPVAQLEEFERDAVELLPRAERDRPWVVSVLAGQAGTPQFESDLTAIEAFNMRHEDVDQGRAIIDVIETRADTSESIDSALNILPDDYYAFFELPVDRDVTSLLETIADGDAGAKVRTGGVTADLYPTPQRLAQFISSCAAANVPFKATAGLHHPLHHRNASVNADEFGFINVFLAACLAMTDELPQAKIAELLVEQSPDAFQFDDDGASWRSHRIESQSIEDVREEFAISFGSCAFDEPCADLRTLGLL